MRRLLVVTSVLVAFATAAGADDLVITRGGRRIIDPDPTTAATNCSGWSYDPAPVAFEDSISNIYSTSGILRDACSDPVPFGDQIWQHQRGTNDVFSGQPVLGRTSFRWMFGDQNIDPQTYIGRLASPSVVHAKGRYFMAFVASVSDPALCGGAHTGQVCGLCKDNFSYYAMYWAAADDNGVWHVFNRDNPVSNIALANALLYRSPSSNDQLPDSQYRGISRVRILLADTYVWFLTQFATSDGTVRTVLLRAPFDPSTDWGINGPLEAWRNDKGIWLPATNSVLPEDFADTTIQSGLDPPVVSISDITQISTDRFVGLIPNGSHVDYVLSNDLVSWTPPRPLRSAIQYFADDRGYAGSVVDPILMEDASNNLHFFMASSDGDSDHGIFRDGIRDCPSTSPTAGLGIYEGIVQLAPIANTTITVAPRANPPAAGVVPIDVFITASDGTLPSGRLTFTVGSLLSISFDVNDGSAGVFTPLTAGTYPVHVSFTSFGPWNPSSADASITVIPAAPPKKRAVRH